MSPIVIGDLLARFDHGKKSQENRHEFQLFLESSRIQIFPITSDTSNFFSHVYVSLRKKGKPIPTNAMWIAAQALEQGCVVCTYDQHFKSIDGLISGNQLAELIV